MGEYNFQEFKKQHPGKKIVILYGNCHTMIISDILSSDLEFSEKYAVYPIKPIQAIESSSYFDQDFFRECDVFIHQDIRHENKYGPEYSSQYVIGKLKKECRTLIIPNLYHMPKFLFPQCDYDKPPLQWKKGNTIFFRDNLIDSCLAQGMTTEKIRNKYLDVSSVAESEIENMFVSFQEKLIEREKNWDIKISDYILKYFKNEQLFYDPSHPTNVLLGQIAYRVKLAVGGGTIEYPHIYVEVQCLDSTEMPIPKAVTGFFRISDVSAYLRNSSNGRKLRDRKMDLTEYINQYILLSWQNEELGKTQREKLFAQFLLNRICTVPIIVVKKAFYKLKHILMC